MTETVVPIMPDFSQAPPLEKTDSISRPSLSYWEDAWRRLKRNRRAITSLYLVSGLLIFTILGPVAWTVDPTLQDLDSISQAPSFSATALVVPDPGLWEGVRIDGPATIAGDPGGPGVPGATNIRVEGTPTTQYVRLVWEPVAGAAFYLVYRNDHQPESAEDLGLPLGQTLTAQELSFEDRLQLQPQTYYYTIIASDGLNEAANFATKAINLERAITVSQALERDLPASPGNHVKLSAHPFGTDYLGRDLLARTMIGAQVSLFIGIVAPFIFVVLGVIYGGVSGYFGGKVDLIMMRFAEFVIALPFVLFMILFRISFGIGPGESGIFPMLLALVLLSWPDAARIVRGQVLQLREEPFVQAARMLGANSWYLIFRHMIPNTLGLVLVTLTFAIPMAIFTEAFLSFIGMGVAPPTPSWGSMSNEGIRSMLSTPHELLFPAFFISVTVLAFNLLGDGLRDALDSRMRSRE
jgi:oligopeptide transport system permease protein